MPLPIRFRFLESTLELADLAERIRWRLRFRFLPFSTILSVAPAILILTTAFTRIVIVLGFVRTALGTSNIPPTQILVGLSLFLTFYVMGPTYSKINDVALQPMTRKLNPISFDQAVERAQGPVREFMLKNTYESDLMLFLDMRKEGRPTNRNKIDIMTLIPAFVISEGSKQPLSASTSSCRSSSST